MKTLLLYATALCIISALAGAANAASSQAFTAKRVMLNPQPLPLGGKATLNARTLPPGGKAMLNPQPLPPGGRAMLNPQPLPPRAH